MLTQIEIFHWSESECRVHWPNGHQITNDCLRPQLAACFVYGKRINGHLNVGLYQRAPFNRLHGHHAQIICCLLPPTKPFCTAFASWRSNFIEVRNKTIATILFADVSSKINQFQFICSCCCSKTIIPDRWFQDYSIRTTGNWRSTEKYCMGSNGSFCCGYVQILNIDCCFRYINKSWCIEYIAEFHCQWWWPGRISNIHLLQRNLWKIWWRCFNHRLVNWTCTILSLALV